MKEGPVCDYGDCVLIRFISAVSPNSLLCMQEMCGLRASHHAAKSNKTSKDCPPRPLPPPSCQLCLNCSLYRKFCDPWRACCFSAAGIWKPPCLLQWALHRFPLKLTGDVAGAGNVTRSLLRGGSDSHRLILYGYFQREEGWWQAQCLSPLDLPRCFAESPLL